MSATRRREMFVKIVGAALAAVLVAAAMPSEPSFARGGVGGSPRGGGGGPGSLGGAGGGALGGSGGSKSPLKMTDPSDYLDQLQREAAEGNLPEFIRIARDGSAFEAADDDRDAGLAAEREAASRRQRKLDVDGSHPQ